METVAPSSGKLHGRRIAHSPVHSPIQTQASFPNPKKKKEKTKMKTKHLAVTLLALALLIGAQITPVLSSSPVISIKTVTETTGALPKDADASIYFVMEWTDFSSNKTINIWCYNGTGDKELIDQSLTGYTIPVTDANSTLLTGDTQGKDGEYTNTFTISDLTEEIGTHTYTMKILDNTDNTTIATKDFTVLVAEADLELAVSVEDAGGDGIIDKDESVIFTYYVNWVSVPDTETHTVWVSFDDGAYVSKGSVSVTAGAGSDTGTFTKVWNSKGAKTVDVELRDSSGAAVTSLTLPITVGEETPAPVTSTPTASQVKTTPIWQNPYAIGSMFIAGIAVTILLVKRN